MPLTVLLVDDDQEFLDVLAERLVIRDMEVTKANSARAALEHLQSTVFDAILLDLEMPETDGLQALKEFTALNPGQPVLLLTGHATVASGVQAMKLGAADVIEKPADIRDLVERIRAAAAARSPGGLPGGEASSGAAGGKEGGFSLGRLFKKKG